MVFGPLENDFVTCSGPGDANYYRANMQRDADMGTEDEEVEENFYGTPSATKIPVKGALAKYPNSLTKDGDKFYPIKTYAAKTATLDSEVPGSIRNSKEELEETYGVTISMSSRVWGGNSLQKKSATSCGGGKREGRDAAYVCPSVDTPSGEGCNELRSHALVPTQ